MSEVNPGSHKYRNSDSILWTLGSDAARRGDAVAIGAAGDAVQSTGDNPFLGVLQTPTAADDTAGVLGLSESTIASGDEVAVALHGVVRAKVNGFDADNPVGAGNKIVDGSNGALVNVSDNATTPAPVPADLDDRAMALTDEDADGFALVHLR
jgi:hypothetical protein